MAQRIADACGAVLDSRPQGIWVKIRMIPEEHYAENGGATDGVLPVLVSVLQAEVPDQSRLEKQASDLAGAVASACKRPVENVHIIFEPPDAGRIAFGGKPGT